MQYSIESNIRKMHRKVENLILNTNIRPSLSLNLSLYMYIQSLGISVRFIVKLFQVSVSRLYVLALFQLMQGN